MRDVACTAHYDNVWYERAAGKARAPARPRNSKDATAEDGIRNVRRVWPPAVRAMTVAVATALGRRAQLPYPNGRGVWPKSQVELAASSNPRFQAATDACGYLLPDGGPGVPPSPAVVQQIAHDMVKFTRCMRSHGVPNWPNYTLDQGRAVFDPQSAGIDPSSPQVSAEMQECEHVFPTSVGLPPGA
jgi:hypothetical protein